MKVQITITDENLNQSMTLTEEQVGKFLECADTIGKDFIDTMKRVIERGCYDVTYRYNRNQEQATINKAMKKVDKAALLKFISENIVK